MATWTETKAKIDDLVAYEAAYVAYAQNVSSSYDPAGYWKLAALYATQAYHEAHAYCGGLTTCMSLLDPPLGNWSGPPAYSQNPGLTAMDRAYWYVVLAEQSKQKVQQSAKQYLQVPGIQVPNFAMRIPPSPWTSRY